MCMAYLYEYGLCRPAQHLTFDKAVDPDTQDPPSCYTVNTITLQGSQRHDVHTDVAHRRHMGFSTHCSCLPEVSTSCDITYDAPSAPVQGCQGKWCTLAWEHSRRSTYSSKWCRRSSSSTKPSRCTRGQKASARCSSSSSITATPSGSSSGSHAGSNARQCCNCCGTLAAVCCGG